MPDDHAPDPAIVSVPHATEARRGDPDPDPESDPLDAFPTEAQVLARAVRRIRRRRATSLGLLVACSLVAIAAILAWLLPAARESVLHAVGFSAAPAVGTLVVETTPPGFDVLEGDRVLGTTPLRASLAAGRHSFLLRKGDTSRPLDVVLASGAQVFHHLDLQGESATGVLNVATAPPGALVDIDGARRGVSPVDVAGLAPGEHSVSVTSGTRVVTQQVMVVPGRTATLLVPVGAPAAPAAGVGFVTIGAPIELQVFDGDSLVGSSRNQRIMLMPGRRALRLANVSLGFERTMNVTVEAGAVAKLTVAVPNGTLSVNAAPWAEVTLDGVVIGETPIANRAVPLGSHEIVLRNPKFPDFRRTVVVTLTAPTRVGVDLRQ
jgi:hypothetical protein